MISDEIFYVSKFHEGNRRNHHKLPSFQKSNNDLEGQPREGKTDHETVEENIKFAESLIPKHYRMPFGMEVFICCEVNGTNIKALINTSLGRTTMSIGGLKKCGILPLLDRKCRRKNDVGIGVITNVGSIHFMIGDFGQNLLLPFSLDVQESLNAFNDFDLLLGLDFMSFHKICINLSENLLEIPSKNDEKKFIPVYVNWLYGPKSLASYDQLDPTIDELTKEFSNNNDVQVPKLKNVVLGSKRSRSSFFVSKNEEWKADIKEQIKDSNIIRNIEFAAKNIPKPFQEPVPMLSVTCLINGKRIIAIIDTASSGTSISSEAVNKCGLNHLIKASNGDEIVEGVGDGRVGMNGIINFIWIGFNSNLMLPCGTIGVVERLPLHLILGLNFLLQHFISLDVGSKCLRIGSTKNVVTIACADFMGFLNYDE